ncbi:RluA family pseudouridine synthase [Rhodoferax sp.]|uniref:RluA family pseudouridine synthase n=1 Tax=Rhodoferax sp. TaxID=50421 RepID=UPI002ACE38BC|nr:RluA family pseudouridine synthase [Rhodoferax sp.]MDZ7919345.1 RluA family pseudouridine synthase [Rhodoferax sp.]
MILSTDDFLALPLEVVYADAAMVVLNKPSGLLTVPGRGPDKQDCLSKRVQARYPDALIVHRLDRDTSGLVVMALGLPAQRVINLAFEQRRVDKRYVAVVTGQLAVSDDWQDIDMPMLVDWPNRPKRTINYAEGQQALTRWRCTAVDTTANTSRVELEPVTGRTHQLRVHMQAIGHPMVGDTLYAPPEVQAQAGRLLLHSGLLSVPHPVDGDQREYKVAPAF